MTAAYSGKWIKIFLCSFVENVPIVEEYVKSNSSIKLINQINKGVSCARNVGLKEASGKFIYFLDSDDTLVPGTLDFFRQIYTIS